MAETELINEELDEIIRDLFWSKVEDREATYLEGLSEEQLAELSPVLLNRYINRSSSRLRQQTYAKKLDNLKTQVKKRVRRVQGIKLANKKINNEPHANNAYTEGVLMDEGILTNLFRSRIAHGLGVSPGMLPRLPKAARPVHTKPAATATAKPTTTTPTKPKWQALEIGHVFQGEPHPEHEHHLTQAINHYNVASWAKHQGDHSRAEIHARASAKHFKNYVANAPKDRLKRLNQERVKQIWQ